MSNYHPATRIMAPDGDRPAIDIMLVPLLKALWKAGYYTVGSCQDCGESVSSVGRKSAYWNGYALLEMPPDDACHLLDMIKFTPQFQNRMHWIDPGAWEVAIPVLPFGGLRNGDAAAGPWAQIRFPNDQIDDLVKVLTDAT